MRNIDALTIEKLIHTLSTHKEIKSHMRIINAFTDKIFLYEQLN